MTASRFVIRSHKVCLFVDNSALFRTLHELGQPRCDYKRLKDYLVRDRDVLHQRFYTGEIRNDAEERAAFYSVLRRAGYDVVGYENPRSTEKNAALDPLLQNRIMCGISWDMCEMSGRGRYDTFILVGGSAAFVDSVELVKGRGVDVEVAFFENFVDPELRDACSKFVDIPLDRIARILHKTDLKPPRRRESVLS